MVGNQKKKLQKKLNNNLVISWTCITFAIVKDGEWFERGEMGWWGVVTNESDRSEWCAKYNELLNGLSDDTLLTLVDCHI